MVIAAHRRSFSGVARRGITSVVGRIKVAMRRTRGVPKHCFSRGTGE